MDRMWKPAAEEAAAAAVKKTITEPENAKDGSVREVGQRFASAGLWRRAGGSGGGYVVVEVAAWAAPVAVAATVVARVATVSVACVSAGAAPRARSRRGGALPHARAPPPQDRCFYTVTGVFCTLYSVNCVLVL